MTTAEKYSLLINEKIPAVHEAGKAQGGGGTFWTDFMNRTDFGYAFYSWNADAFNPDIDLVFKGDITRAFYMFNANTHGNEEVDMIDLLAKCGVTLDFSKATDATYLCGSSKIKTLPTLNFTSLKNFGNCFNNSPIEKIEKIILKDDGSQTFEGSTFHCRRSIGNNLWEYTLQHIAFEGVIGNNITFQYCPNLTAESYASIINHLHPTNNFTVTLPPYEIVKSVYDAKYGDGTWDNMVGVAYSNVTFVYS